MKVTCSKCGTEYNFDDAKVTEEGVKVKCTRCENVFRVRKKAFMLTEPVQVTDPAMVPADIGPPEPSQPSQPFSSGGGERTWMVRKSLDGEMLDFSEMTTLQRWIVERRVGRDDEISHNGVKWKRLGTIPELSPFFNVVNGTSDADSPTNPGRKREAPRGQPAVVKGESSPDPSAGGAQSGSDVAERSRHPNAPPSLRKSRNGFQLVLIVLSFGVLATWAFTENGQEGITITRNYAKLYLAKLSATPAATALVAASETPLAAVSPEPAVSASPTATEGLILPTAIVVESPTPVETASAAPTRVAHLSVEARLQKGYEAYSRGRYREAVVQYQAAVNADPTNSEAYALLGLAYLDSGQDELAESSLEASVRLNPRFADAHRYLGLLYSKRGDKGRAVQSFNTYLDLRPNGPTSDDVRKRVASLQGG